MSDVELSTMALYERLSDGNGQIGDISALCWPGYRRVTVSDGGDATASFSFGGDDGELERWLEHYLAAHFVEMWAGQYAFVGRIVALRLTYNGVMMAHELDTVFNSVACYYTSVYSGATYLSDFYDDTESQATWGKRMMLIRPTAALGLAQAQELAQQTLEQVAQPQISRGRVQWSPGQAAVLKVQVAGYPESLDARTYTEESETEADASAEVQAALADADFVSEGEIEENTKQVSRLSDHQPVLQRIKWVAQQRDADGRRYNYGCFGSRSFDYQPADEDQIRYYLRAKTRIPRHEDADHNHIPAPLVVPGGVSFVSDIMPGRPTAPRLLDDPRAQFDKAVDYSAQGAVLRGPRWGAGERAHALEMAIVAGGRR